MNPNHRSFSLCSHRFGMRFTKSVADRMMAAGLLLLAFVLGNLPALCEGTFEDANRMYQQGKFLQAAQAYEALVSSGKATQSLYFNLGNAWQKAGRPGRAIAAYLRAQRLTPRDSEVLANLSLARASTQAPRAVSTSQRWLERVSLNEWTVITCVGLWLWLIGLGIGCLRPSSKTRLRWWVRGASILTCVAGILLAFAASQRLGHKIAVVVATDASLKHGPLDESPVVQPLPEGLELDVLESEGGWHKVRGAARGIGWVKDAHLSVLEP